MAKHDDPEYLAQVEKDVVALAKQVGVCVCAAIEYGHRNPNITAERVQTEFGNLGQLLFDFAERD